MKVEEMAPRWAKAIEILDRENGRENLTEYIKYVESQHLDMGNFAKCIVGESHGFDDWYLNRCKECSDSAMLLALDIVAYPIHFKQALKEFEDHMCEKHPGGKK